MNTIDHFKKLFPHFDKIHSTETFSSQQIKCMEFILSAYQGKTNTFDKKSFRMEYKKKRNAIDRNTLNEVSEKITKKLVSHREFKNASSVFCYYSFSSEIKTRRFIKECLFIKKQVYLPRLENGIMVIVPLTRLDDLVYNSYGIPEPKATLPSVSPDKIDLCIVPGLAFNSLGFRIGYGGGYYDRFLAHFKGHSIGIVASEFHVDTFIPEMHDIPVNEVISEL